MLINLINRKEINIFHRHANEFKNGELEAANSFLKFTTLRNNLIFLFLCALKSFYSLDLIFIYLT